MGGLGGRYKCVFPSRQRSPYIPDRKFIESMAVGGISNGQTTIEKNPPSRFNTYAIPKVSIGRSDASKFRAPPPPPPPPPPHPAFAIACRETHRAVSMAIERNIAQIGRQIRFIAYARWIFGCRPGVHLRNRSFRDRPSIVDQLRSGRKLRR